MCIGRLLDSGKVSFCKSKLKVENNFSKTTVLRSYFDRFGDDWCNYFCTAVLVWLNREKP